MLAALIPYRGRPPIGGHRRHRTITRPSSTRPPSAGHQVHVDHEARHHQERRHEVHVPSGPPASHHASHHATGRHQDKRRHGQRPRCATEAPRASQRVRPSAGPPAAIPTWETTATIRTTTRPSGRHQDRATAGGRVSAPPPATGAPPDRLSRRRPVHGSVSQAGRPPATETDIRHQVHPDQTRQGKRYPNAIGRVCLRRYFA